MPFQSDKQRKFLFKFHPDVAKKFAHDKGGNSNPHQEAAKHLMKKRAGQGTK